MDLDFIVEMEQIEEILRVKWNEFSSSKCVERAIIWKLFLLLKDQECITGATFQAVKMYEKLKDESDGLGRREKGLFREFRRWVKSERDGQHFEEQLDAVMELYQEVVRLTGRIRKEWRLCDKNSKKLGLELKNLNSALTGFPQKLEQTDVLEFGKFRWPLKQSKKVSKTIEHSFEQMEYIRYLTRRLNDKHRILNSVFQHTIQY